MSRICRKHQVPLKAYEHLDRRYNKTYTSWHCPECDKERMRLRRKAIGVEEARRRQNERYAKLRDEVIAGYGGKCSCCGETNPLFLTIDHVDGKVPGEPMKVFRGRTTVRPANGAAMFNFIKKNEYPAGYRVMCFNCNLGRERNGGVCPHKGSVEISNSACKSASQVSGES